jgi:hypothetical protein
MENVPWFHPRLFQAGHQVMKLRWSHGAFWKATSTSSVLSVAPSVVFTNPPIELLSGPVAD